MICIDPQPAYVWYQDMVDFVEGISDERSARSLGRAIQGSGAFRRFKDRLHADFPQLLPPWYAFRDSRGVGRAVQWLVDNSLVDAEDATRFLTGHPDPDLP